MPPRAVRFGELGMTAPSRKRDDPLVAGRKSVRRLALRKQKSSE